MVGQAFVFDGTHRDRVNLGNPTNLRLEDFTLVAWVKRSSPTVTSFDVLGADGSVAGEGGVVIGYGRGGYGFGLANNGRMVLGNIDMDGIISTPLVTSTSWHHLAATKSGTNAVFYMDGVPQVTPPYVHPVPYTFDDVTCACTAAISIGSRGDARGGTFFGMIDEPAIYNRALSASEIQQLFEYESRPGVVLLKSVRLSFSNMKLGTNYQLQVSSDMNAWTDHGSAFTATNTSMIYSHYWDVENWSDLFFRLSVSP